MKPVVIYTMPRTIGTATLQACKRTHKFNEPFETYNLPNFSGSVHSLLNQMKTLTEYYDWDSLSQLLNMPNSASKIFGHGLQYFYPARSWFASAQSTHEIFVLVRNVREMIISELLAQHLGYNLESAKEDHSIYIDETQFFSVNYIISTFLRFYPVNARLITFETLPVEFFDKSSATHAEQHLQYKTSLIQNLDQVNANIDLIMSYHKAEWKDATGLDIFA